MIENKLILLVGRDGRPSMAGTYKQMTGNAELHVRRRLANPAGKILKEYWRVYTNHNVDDFEKVNINNNDFTNKIIVRWGNTIPLNLDNSITYNTANAIAKATNKKFSREIFIKAGLPCPKLLNENTHIDDIKFPVIARPLKHAKGKNFIVLKNKEDLNTHLSIDNGLEWYYSEFVDKKQEFRLHIGHQRILNYLEKPNPNNGNLAWNRAQNDDPFVNVKWNDYNGDLCKVAIKALQALGLDFGKRRADLSSN